MIMLSYRHNMKYLDITFPTPEHNLSCDEALLDLSEEGFEGEILRFWEPQEYFIVLGYSGKIQSEVHLSACREKKIPIFRRTSGGGTILQGPGCLNYSLILKIQKSSPLAHISKTNRFIMERNREALASVVGNDIEIQGFSDLVRASLKFSGSAQRRKKSFLLYHGSFLLSFPILLMDQLLQIPLRQPAYRKNRSHSEFVTNLNIPPNTIKQSIRKIWNANRALEQIPSERIEQFVRERYITSEWNFKF
ncbi:MAG: lipoate--protein ligase family protein [Candidatus Omnitrophica bacterium]|nr:lipoate--protein ligase family protein [Candidatus Omnitrophota bacterium]